ncbi:glycoside hydrolase family 65 [Paenibacillus chartarius]|uniref:Glycoside hydrolase family 65 n=1 Tax=Paenibacillus chartarius TaxID=747481 RepID=A0ABV6DK45_9BACL
MIDRKALAQRHNPVIRSFDRFSSLTVGNGNYAFTVDATGLQTFPELYADGGVPLSHLSNWAWHTSPNPQGYRPDTFPLTEFQTYNGRSIGFPYLPAGQTTEEYKWLKFNPHKLHLGRIGFRLDLPSGEEAGPDDITGIEQTLDLWTGMIDSRFSLSGTEARVCTCCHPELDLIAVRIRSGLIGQGRLRIAFHFPYGTWKFTAADWGKPDRHSTQTVREDACSVVLRRTLDEDEYGFMAAWSDGGKLLRDESDPHLLVLVPPPDRDEFELRFRCVPEAAEGELPGFEAVKSAAASHWAGFWTSGAAVELAGSRDPRAAELERRIVLSQYVTAVQSSGSLPSAESGLTHNSWAGKFHLEMHWWHSVHFALWNRTELLANNLSWYGTILDQARALAASQGYEGARWPKCVAPDGVGGPCYIEPFLIWQQPHPIYYAELIYRIKGGRATLDAYAELVFESADFMASFAEWDEARRRYVLGPPVAPAQEIYDHAVTINPTFELAYWAFGLSTANVWRERLGLPRSEKWDHVLRHLSPLPVSDGLYDAAESVPHTLADAANLKDHPTMLAPLGFLPGVMTDRETMRRTFDAVMQRWNWDATWGWDYPLTAMTAARLGKPEAAVDILLMDKTTNTYLPNGHNYQRKPLTVYLPGNGGLLTAVAMMAGGWDGAPGTHAPGFPQDGSWHVQAEGLVPMI